MTVRGGIERSGIMALMRFIRASIEERRIVCGGEENGNRRGSIGGWKCRAGTPGPPSTKSCAPVTVLRLFCASAALGMVVTRPCVPVACAGTTAGTGVAVDGVNPEPCALRHRVWPSCLCFPAGKRGRLASLADALALVTEHEPDFSRIFWATARSSKSPSREMLDHKDVELGLANGAATLFFTILTRVREPVTTSPSLMAAMRRISMRTENRTSARGRRSWFPGCRTSRRSFRDLIDENQAGTRLGDRSGQLAQRLRHEAACSPMWLSPISPSSSALGRAPPPSPPPAHRWRSSAPVLQRFPAPARHSRVARPAIIYVHAELLGIGGMSACSASTNAAMLQPFAPRQSPASDGRFAG